MTGVSSAVTCQLLYNSCDYKIFFSALSPMMWVKEYWSEGHGLAGPLAKHH